jgi:hypothetical protein
MADEEKQKQPLEEQSAQPQPPASNHPEEELVPFLDKFIAFVILAIPFSALLVYVQDLLIERFSKSVTNIVLLTGIVVFLLSIGTVAKRIHAYRTK